MVLCSSGVTSDHFRFCAPLTSRCRGRYWRHVKRTVQSGGELVKAVKHCASAGFAAPLLATTGSICLFYNCIYYAVCASHTRAVERNETLVTQSTLCCNSKLCCLYFDEAWVCKQPCAKGFGGHIIFPGGPSRLVALHYRLARNHSGALSQKCLASEVPVCLFACTFVIFAHDLCCNAEKEGFCADLF